MSEIVVITSAVSSPVTLAMAKAQARARDFDDDDDLLQLYVDTGTEWLCGPAGWLDRSLNPQTLERRQRLFTAAGDPDWEDIQGQSLLFGAGEERWSPRIKLPCGPVISIEQITYVDLNGVIQTVDPSIYTLTGDTVQPAYQQTWPIPRGDANGVRIRYVGGYALTTDETPLSTVPAPIRQAILLLVSHFYAHPDAVVGVDNRDSSTPLPLGVDDLLAQYRIYR